MTRNHYSLASTLFVLAFTACGSVPESRDRFTFHEVGAEMTEAGPAMSVEAGVEAAMATEGGRTDARMPEDAFGDAEPPDATPSPWAPCKAWPDAMEGGDLYWKCTAPVTIPVLCPGTMNLLISAGCQYERHTTDLAGDTVTELCCPET